MVHQFHRFKVVIIDYPVLCLDDPFVSSLLGRTLKMKYEGYASTYDDSVLPMDQTDFFATHLILCEEVYDKLIPVIAYKSISYERCLKHKVEFPALALMKTDGQLEAAKAVENLLLSVGDPHKISYEASCAQNLSYRNSKEEGLKETIRELLTMMLVQHHHEFSIPHMLICGIPRVGTDLLLQKMGLSKINTYAEFKQSNLNKEPAVLLYREGFNNYAEAVAKKHIKIWDKRLFHSKDQVQKKPIAA